MARAAFTAEQLLDAARDVIVERGARAATIEAIAHASGAPVGSIYHRFGSIDELLARAWMRAARRLQETALSVAADSGAPLESAVAVALSQYEHCLREPADVLLLDALDREELLRGDLGAARAELERLNGTVEARMSELARALFGRADRSSRDLVLLALVDLPHGFVRRQIATGVRAPARRQALARAVRAVLSPG